MEWFEDYNENMHTNMKDCYFEDRWGVYIEISKHKQNMRLRSGYLGHTELWPQVVDFVLLLRQFLVHSRQVLTHHAELTLVTFGGGL